MKISKESRWQDIRIHFSATLLQRGRDLRRFKDCSKKQRGDSQSQRREEMLHIHQGQPASVAQ